MYEEIAKVYGNRVRVRACGLCWEGENLLLVNHVLADKDLWAPPGGGIEFGEAIEVALKREFKEETGLNILIEGFMFGCEFINVQLHAIELFFECKRVSGQLLKGEDPELQIISDVRFLTPKEIRSLPQENIHGILRKTTKKDELKKLRGFYTI